MGGRGGESRSRFASNLTLLGLMAPRWNAGGFGSAVNYEGLRVDPHLFTSDRVKNPRFFIIVNAMFRNKNCSNVTEKY
jgi:hypothetical protein